MEGNGSPPIANLLTSSVTPTAAHTRLTFLDSSSSEQPPVRPSVEPGDSAGDQGETNASVAAAIQLFPSELANSIRRIPDPKCTGALVAAVWIAFPPPPDLNKIQCTMSLELTDEKVQYYAWELFRVRTETKDGLQYIYDGGAKVLPNPKTTLQGCRREVTRFIFGNETADGIAANPIYQDEERQGRDRTDCISMVISQQACEGAIIYIRLGEREGTEIKKKLYR